ncbi:hypothetical protein QOZ89_10240 [Pseudofrankia sp. BMG5.37]|nr:hypothetical protein [Pseudofrankia sp. BMG5.37]MDT3439991.1 hypothetical protein [Pseudofrankia sp. BMG5.37]
MGRVEPSEWPWADPVVGLAITVAILRVLRSAARVLGARLMDAVDPDLVAEATTTLLHTVDDTRNVPYRASGGPTSGVFEVFVQHADGGGTVADG